MAIAEDIYTRVGDLLFDPTHTTWTVDMLLRFVNDGQREIASERPESANRTLILSLEDGVRQQLPAGYRRFVRMPRNITILPDPPPSPRVLFAETNGSTSVFIQYVSGTEIGLLCTIPYTASRAGERTGIGWVDFQAVWFNNLWYVVLGGENKDLFTIDRNGVYANISDNLGITWGSLTLGPRSVAATDAGVVVTHGSGYRFSSDGVNWQDKITSPPNFTGTRPIVGADGVFYTEQSPPLYVSTDGLNYTAAGTSSGTEDIQAFVTFTPQALTADDVGVLALAEQGKDINWMTTAGPHVGLWVTIPGGVQVSKGNGIRTAEINASGVMTATGAHFLITTSADDETAGPVSVLHAPTLAAISADSYTESVVSASPTFGYGLFDVDTVYVAICQNGVYISADLATFVAQQVPASYESYIGAGGWIQPAAITLPAAWP